MADPWLEPSTWNCDRVRERVTSIVGAGGHEALLRISFAPVRDEFPWLSAVRVEEGRLTGLGAVLPEQSVAERKAAGTAIRKRYVDLLLAFVGADLTRKIVGDDWPELLPAPARPPRSSCCFCSMSPEFDPAFG